ncbi:MAG: hypothetical protein FRX49_13425 [Trebouxia sp. A1-2]|nr:MAG: hypothetical protein FRX49_13425 [Trebouxia sp. A1-2]
MQQRVVRCQEEVQIVVRETQDAAAFYTQQLGTLTAAIEAMEAGGSNCTTALQTLSTVVRTDDFETAGSHAHLQWPSLAWFLVERTIEPVAQASVSFCNYNGAVQQLH